MEVIAILDDLQEVIFPGYYGPREMTEENVPFYVGERIDRVASRLTREAYHAFNQRCDKTQHSDCDHCHDLSEKAVTTFLGSLVEIRRLLQTDVQAGFDGDPAASGPDEIIFCYPGLYAITVYRLANVLLPPGRADHPAHDDRARAPRGPASTSTPARPSARRSSSTTAPASSSARRRDIGQRRAALPGRDAGRAVAVVRGAPRSLRGHKRHPTIEDDVVDLRQRHHPRRQDGDRPGRGDRRQLLGHAIGAGGGEGDGGGGEVKATGED